MDEVDRLWMGLRSTVWWWWCVVRASVSVPREMAARLGQAWASMGKPPARCFGVIEYGDVRDGDGKS